MANLLHTVRATDRRVGWACLPPPPRRTFAGRSFVLVSVLAAISFSGMVGCSGPPSSEPERPGRGLALEGTADGLNLLLITIDTLRADRLGSFGHPSAEQSPAIDELAGAGVRFLNANAPRSLTWPSLASVLTGQYPSGHGLTQNGYRFADDQETLPRLLQEDGYRTAAILSNMCDANHLGWDRVECAGGVDQRVNRKALAWLDESDSEEPFFLWVHYFGAHGPYYNGGDRAARRFPDYTGPVQGKKHALNRIMTEGIELEDRDVEYLDALYDAAVQGTDALVGEFVSEVFARVDRSKTVIVLLADHGEDLYDHHGYLYHACSPYESSLHVPLLMALPDGANAGTAVSQPVELIDVLPTLAELFGLEPTACIDGASLVPYLERPERTGDGKAALSEYGLEKIATVRHGRWKLIVNPDEHRPICLPGAPSDLYPIARRELYDLSVDPGEQNEVAASNEQVVEQLMARLNRRQEQRCGGGDAIQTLPPEVIQELEAMGYVAR